MTPPSPLERALAAVKQARQRLEEVERSRHEPIAIVGMGCRLPGGVDSPQALWDLLSTGADAIREVPEDRWKNQDFYHPDPSTPGKMSMRQGGFLDDVAHFDARFFGITPKEAEAIDPQQRLLLEVAWQALEDAGIPAGQLRGKSGGVFVGVNSNDYLQLQLAEPESVGTYTIVGGAGSIAANRLSYTLDLRGPSLAVDTACSSSLVAVHLACQSLRSGESDIALAGGVQLILSPFCTLAHAKGLPLAEDGRCKTFDHRADGYVRGEGCAVVVLKTLSRALADGDNPWALLRGSAVNQDGRTNGLTAPNGLSQQSVIRRALANATLEPHRISYVEAHGTGTALGDPIEVEALREVYGGQREEGEPLTLGSIKTNFGHLEAAAGITGLVKVALALQRHQLPPNLHFEKLNPHISLGDGALSVATELRYWPAHKDPRAAALSSFGAGGTNAHVVLEEAPAIPTEDLSEEFGSRLLLLSARSEASLRALAQSYREWLRPQEGKAPELAALTRGAAHHRDHHPLRLSLVAPDAAAMADRLKEVIDGEMAVEQSLDQPPAVVFVFPGQGSQWLGMGRDLLATEPVFRDTIDLCDRAARDDFQGSIRQCLESGEELHKIEEVQPVLWGVQVALATLWRHLGVEPAAVIGHSMGEVAAATVAGILTHEDAARVICRRSRLLRRVSGQGAMALIALGEAEVREALGGQEHLVSVAVSNGPRSTVISGDTGAVEDLMQGFKERNIFCRAVKVDVASHSPQMDPLFGDLAEALANLSPQTAEIPLFSTVEARWLEGPEMNTPYWLHNLRNPVRFAEGIAALLDSEHRAFVEMSPHPILLSAVEQNIAHAETRAWAFPSLRRDEEANTVLLETLGGLYGCGFPLDLQRLWCKTEVPRPLPTYPFTGERHWFTQETPQARPTTTSAVPTSAAPSPSSQATQEAKLPPLLQSLAVARTDQRHELLTTFVGERVAQTMGFSRADEIEPEAGFFQLGMDSMMAGRLRASLERGLGRSLPATVVFEHPTIFQLVEYLETLDFEISASPPTSPQPSTTESDTEKQRAAGEGIAGRAVDVQLLTPEQVVEKDWERLFEELRQMPQDDLLAELAAELATSGDRS